MEIGKRNQVLAVLFAGVLMGALDIAIVGPALPAIQAEFGVGTRELAWIFSMYVLFNLIGTPLMAKLSDYYGRRTVYVLDVALFALGSLVVAFSRELGGLIGVGGFAVLLVGRAIQGGGAGGIFPVASAVIGDTFPPDKRGGALGLIGAVFGLAFLIGPVVGGLLLGFGWPWLFLVNLPVAALVAVAAWLLLPHTRIAEAGGFDWFGMLTLAGALGSLVYGLSAIDTANFITSVISTDVWPYLAASAVAGLLLVVVEARHREPVFPVRVFANRQLVVTNLLTAGAGLGESSLVFLPLLAVAGLAVDAVTASYLLLPVVIAMAVGSPLSGRLLDTFGSKAVILAGTGVMSAGLILLSQFGFTRERFIVSGALIGLGLSALLGAPIRYVTLNETGPHDRSAAQAMVAIFTSIGQLVGSSLVGAVAASFGGRAPGYRIAFLMIGIIGGVLLILATFLKSRDEERATRQG